MKNSIYLIKFSRFVNGIEQLIEVHLIATSKKDSGNQLDKMMKYFVDVEYKINEIIKVS